MAATTLPPISPTLQAAIRQYGLANGWKNAARRLAYGPTVETAAATVAKRRNGHRRGRKLALACIWFEDGRLHVEEYPKGTEDLWLERAHELDATRFSREAPQPFGAARPETATILDETDIRLAQYAPRECCGSPMGIMEAWTCEGRDGEELQHTVTAVYQCAVNRKHQQEA